MVVQGALGTSSHQKSTSITQEKQKVKGCQRGGNELKPGNEGNHTSQIQMDCCCSQLTLCRDLGAKAFGLTHKTGRQLVSRYSSPIENMCINMEKRLEEDTRLAKKLVQVFQATFLANPIQQNKDSTFVWVVGS